MQTFKPLQNTNLSEAISEQIANRITTGALKPGDRLPTESELMGQFEVGRSTVREAVKSLAIAGLIETRRGGGSFVKDTFTGFLNNRLNWTTVFSQRELQDVIEVRYALEGQAAALAAERSTPEEKERLWQIVTELENSMREPEQAARYDMAFHDAVFEAARNPILLGLINSIRAVVHNYIKAGYTPAMPRTDFLEHRRILEAIQAGQPEEASRLMHLHLRLTRDRRLKK